MDKIAIVGAGYVGMSTAILFAKKNNVVILDIDRDRIEKINKKESPVDDDSIQSYLDSNELFLKATLSPKKAYLKASIVIVATPTDFNNESNSLDTSIVDKVVKEILSINNKCLIVIKSTIPIGHTEFLKKNHSYNKIIFSPEFLREGQALKDNFYPSRIIIGGGKDKVVKDYLNHLKKTIRKKNSKILHMSSSEAESVKLFSNTYLAMRVSFFNELDSLALQKELNVKKIIKGVSLDPRIGDHYCNPSFGYGGYCLPKDTKQLLSHFKEIPQALMKAIVDSNKVRKLFLTKKILEKKPKSVGVYKLAMKQGVKNSRSSAIKDIIEELVKNKIKINLYESNLPNKKIKGVKNISNLQTFLNLSDLVIANRDSHKLINVKEKLFTRDIFNDN